MGRKLLVTYVVLFLPGCSICCDCIVVLVFWLFVSSFGVLFGLVVGFLGCSWFLSFVVDWLFFIWCFVVVIVVVVVVFCCCFYFVLAIVLVFSYVPAIVVVAVAHLSLAFALGCFVLSLMLCSWLTIPPKCHVPPIWEGFSPFLSPNPLLKNPFIFFLFLSGLANPPACYRNLSRPSGPKSHDSHSHTPHFRGHSRDTPGTFRAPKARETLVAGRGVYNSGPLFVSSYFFILIFFFLFVFFLFVFFFFLLILVFFCFLLFCFFFLWLFSCFFILFFFSPMFFLHFLFFFCSLPIPFKQFFFLGVAQSFFLFICVVLVLLSVVVLKPKSVFF